jgi:ElaB/YqjD/DUF883 family membrane-anchored ribosome-binding protein
MTASSTGKTLPAEDISHKPDGVVERVSSGAHTAVDQAERKAIPAISHVAEMAHHAVDATAERVAPAADWLAEHRDSLKASEKRLLAETCGYVQAHPIASLGMAVVAGFVLSRVLRS